MAGVSDPCGGDAGAATITQGATFVTLMEGVQRGDDPKDQRVAGTLASFISGGIASTGVSTNRPNVPKSPSVATSISCRQAIRE